MGINATLTLNDGDPVLSGTQIYAGQQITLTLTAQALGESLNLSTAEIQGIQFYYYNDSNAQGTLVSTPLTLTWTMSDVVAGTGDDGDANWEAGEYRVWTASYTIPAEIATVLTQITVGSGNTIAGFDTGINVRDLAFPTPQLETSGATAAGITVVEEPNPSLILEKTADHTSYNSVGETINYRFEIKNDGNRVLTAPVLTDDKTANEAAVYLHIGDTDADGVRDDGETWSTSQVVVGDTNRDGDVDDGETWSFVGEDAEFAVVGDGDVDGNFDPDETWVWSASYTTGADDKADIVNTAEAVASYGTQEVSDDDTVTVTYDPPAAPAITLTKTADVASVDAAGDVITYTFTVDNSGDVALTDVALTDPMFGEDAPTYVSGDTGEDGILGADETWTYTASYTVTQTDLDSWGGGDGEINNTAEVSASYDGEDYTDPGSADVDLVLDASIDVVKTGYRVTDLTPQFDHTGMSDAEIITTLLNSAQPWTTYTTADVGQQVAYLTSVENDGNVALGIENIVDTLTPGRVFPLRDKDDQRVLGDTDGDDLIDVGETWYLGSSYTITEADVGNDIDNTVTVYASNAAVGEDSEVSALDDHEIEFTMLYEGLSQGYWGTHIPGATKKGEKADQTWSKDALPLDGIQKYMDTTFETFFFGSQQDSVSWGSKISGKSIVNIADIKLSEAVNVGAGGHFALARDAAAAVMNAERGDITYKYTVAEIQTMVRDAFNIGDDGANEWSVASLQAVLNANNNLGLLPDAPVVTPVGTADLSWLMAEMG